MVIETGARHRIPVAVCGEMAGDARMTPLLLALGLSEFSLHPGTLLEVRRAIREADALRARARSCWPRATAAPSNAGWRWWPIRPDTTRSPGMVRSLSAGKGI